VPPWAVRNAELHGWEHLSAVAGKLNARHRYLVSLTPEARLRLYSVEAQMRRFEQDRDWALMGVDADRAWMLALAEAAAQGVQAPKHVDGASSRE